MPLSRRDFLKLAAASIVAAPMPCLSGEALPRALWLQRDKEWGLIDIESSEGYRQACWLLRDTQAGRAASASMRLLQTVQPYFTPTSTPLQNLSLNSLHSTYCYRPCRIVLDHKKRIYLTVRIVKELKGKFYTVIYHFSRPPPLLPFRVYIYRGPHGQPMVSMP